MAHPEHGSEVARRIFDLLYLIWVTEKLGEETQTLSANFVDGYNHAVDDIIDAIKCEFDIVDLAWLWEE